MNDWGAAPVIPVSLLVSSARLLIERHLGLAWISGEVSNCTRAASGHTYFVLKDDRAQVRCVLFRMRAQLLDFALIENGFLALPLGLFFGRFHDLRFAEIGLQLQQFFLR